MGAGLDGPGADGRRADHEHPERRERLRSSHPGFSLACVREGCSHRRRLMGHHCGVPGVIERPHDPVGPEPGAGCVPPGRPPQRDYLPGFVLPDSSTPLPTWLRRSTGPTWWSWPCRPTDFALCSGAGPVAPARDAGDQPDQGAGARDASTDDRGGGRGASRQPGRSAHRTQPGVEVATGQPTASVVALADQQLVEWVQELLSPRISVCTPAPTWSAVRSPAL